MAYLVYFMLKPSLFKNSTLFVLIASSINVLILLLHLSWWSHLHENTEENISQN